MSDEGTGSKVVAAAVAIVGIPALVVWAGAKIAAHLAGQPLEAGLADAVRASARLPSTVADPAAAWDQASFAPSPAEYWAGTAVALAVVVALALAALAVWRRLRHVGTVERSRLGVDARAWLARPRDLRPLFVDGPRPGRFILGRVGRWPNRHLIATECRSTTRRSRRPGVGRRQGDIGSVALIGPTRSGKTVAAIAGILEWDGPAILSSVETDLIAATIGWRARLGEVRVYDPFALTPATGSGWSPLAQANTISGASGEARNLLAAIADDGTTNFGLWKKLAESLLSGLFWVAAHTGRDMASVVEWVLTQDRPRRDAPSEVDALVRELLGHPDPAVAIEAPSALARLLAAWKQEERTLSSIYVTAQAALGAFADPAISAAACRNDIDIDWLLSGNNTIYICSPLKDQERLAPAFGGLVNDLFAAMYERKRRNNDGAGELARRVLFVLDEAGNQRLDNLPQYVSTVAHLGVVLVTIWQSMAQITSAYDRRAGIVLTNHLSKVFYTGLSDEDSLAYVGRVLGDEEIEARQLSDHPPRAGPPDATDSTTRVALAQAHTLRQMRPGDALLLHATLPPAHIRTRRYFAERALRRRAELPIPAALQRPTSDTPADNVDIDVLDVFATQREELLARIDTLASAAAEEFEVVED